MTNIHETAYPILPAEPSIWEVSCLQDGRAAEERERRESHPLIFNRDQTRNSVSHSLSSLIMSFDFERGFHSDYEVRGNFSRSAFPCLRLSILEEATADSILILLTPSVSRASLASREPAHQQVSHKGQPEASAVRLILPK